MLERVGPYRVEGEVGRGGMGVVYRAVDERLDRVVAIKALPEELAQDPGRLARFEREAKALAAVSHPNLAGIYGVEEQDGHRFLVLEFVDGETLADRLDRGAMPVDEAIEVCVQIAAGMESAHEAGVVHRDLKPANIKITTEGQAKVLDFGLAKGEPGASTSGTGLSESPTLTSPQMPRSPTVEGAILGTAAYMSPEQARGRGVDKRTDIWAFGVILYECLTGVGPFVGETATDSIGAVLHKEVELDRLPRETPPLVRHVLARCLERDKSRRFRDIGDVRVELEEAHRSWGVQAPVLAAQTRGSWIGWAVAAVSIGIALVLVAVRPSAADPPLVRSSIVLPEGRQMHDFAVSPDGAAIAFVCSTFGDVEGNARAEVQTLMVRPIGGESFVELPGSEGAWYPRFSPDGSTLAYLVSEDRDASTGWRLVRVPADLSSSPVEIMRVAGMFRIAGSPRFAWTADGMLVFVSEAEQLCVTIDPGTGRELARLPMAGDAETPDFVGLIEPFGDRHVSVLLQRFDETGYHLDGGVMEVATGIVSTIVRDAGMTHLSESGDLFFARADRIYRAPFDLGTMRMTGEIEAVQSGLATAETFDHGWFTVSNDGMLAYWSGSIQGASRRLMLIEPDGAETIWGDETRAFTEDIAISPDGSRLAVIIASPGGVYELWVSEVDRPRLRRLLATAATDYHTPVFTPDGEHIVVAQFDPADDKVGALFVVRFDGTAEPTEILRGWERSEWVEPSSVTPDGDYVVLQRFLGGKSRTTLIPIDGGGPERELLAGTTVYDASFAPGGEGLLAYISDETGQREAFVRRVSDDGLGPAVPVTTRGAVAVRWASTPDDGLALRYVTMDQREFFVVLEDPESLSLGDPEQTPRNVRTDNLDVAISFGGRALTIRPGENERPATRLEIARGWLDSLDRDR